MSDKRLEIVLAAKDATKGVFTKVGGHMGRLQKQVFSLHGAMTALAGAAGMGYVIKQNLEFADAIAKTADKIGIATDALQEYRFAADHAGVNQKALDMGLQRFNRRLAEAAKGQGVLKDILKEYGIAVRDSSGNVRDSEAILNDYANAIANAESEQEQLRLAFKAFDSEGAALVNMLKQGGAGLDQMRQRARDLGIVIDEHLLRESEAANDAIADLTGTLDANFKKIILELAPKITDVSENMTKWVTANQKLITQEVPEYLDKLFTRFTKLTDIVWKLSKYTRMVTFGLDDVMKIADYFSDADNQAESVGSKWDKTVGKLTPNDVSKPIGAVDTIDMRQNNTLAPGYFEAIADLEAAEENAPWNEASSNWVSEMDAIAQGMANAMSTSFFDPMSDNFMDMEDMAKNVLLSIQQNLVSSLSQDLIQGLFGGGTDASGNVTQGLIGKASSGIADWITTSFFHDGGVVGSTPAPTAAVHPSVFVGAPRLHNGLKPDEFPAILQQGETVIPKGGGGDVYNINIKAVDAKSFADLARQNPQAIIGPVDDHLKRGGGLRNTIRSTR